MFFFFIIILFEQMKQELLRQNLAKGVNIIIKHICDTVQDSNFPHT